MMNMKWIMAALLGMLSVAANAQVSVSVGGQIKPGVYGRIVINDGYAPPPVLYAQPVVITQPVIVHAQPVAPVAPIYMHVPPGHAKKWYKHCHRYGACGTQVYFVKGPDYRYVKYRKHKHDDDDDDDDDDD
jgi:hypothetical protein